MRKLFATIATAGLLSMSAMSGASAAPVPGFEAQYAAALAACTPPAGTPGACTAAINALSAAMIAAGVPQATALASFTALRSEVAAAGGFEDIFEELLPDSGAVTPPAPAAGGTPAASGGSTGTEPTPASPT